METVSPTDVLYHQIVALSSTQIHFRIGRIAVEFDYCFGSFLAPVELFHVKCQDSAPMGLAEDV